MSPKWWNVLAVVRDPRLEELVALPVVRTADGQLAVGIPGDEAARLASDGLPAALQAAEGRVDARLLSGFSVVQARSKSLAETLKDKLAPGSFSLNCQGKVGHA